MLLTAIETLEGFVNVYGRLNSFPEIFLPISTILHELAQQENMPDVLQDKFGNVAKVIEAKTEEHYVGRQPLRMRKQKAVPIKLLNPKFEEKYFPFFYFCHDIIHALIVLEQEPGSVH